MTLPLLYSNNAQIKYPLSDFHEADVPNDILLDLSISTSDAYEPIVGAIRISPFTAFISIEDRTTRASIGVCAAANPVMAMVYPITMDVAGFGWVVYGPGLQNIYYSGAVAIDIDPECAIPMKVTAPVFLIEVNGYRYDLFNVLYILALNNVLILSTDGSRIYIDRNDAELLATQLNAFTETDEADNPDNFIYTIGGVKPDSSGNIEIDVVGCVRNCLTQIYDLTVPRGDIGVGEGDELPLDVFFPRTYDPNDPCIIYDSSDMPSSGPADVFDGCQEIVKLDIVDRTGDHAVGTLYTVGEPVPSSEVPEVSSIEPVISSEVPEVSSPEIEISSPGVPEISSPEIEISSPGVPEISSEGIISYRYDVCPGVEEPSSEIPEVSSPAPEPVDPYDLSGFMPWIDLDFSVEDDITFNGTKIITIVDRNGNGRSATQAADANRFEWVENVQNGNAVARGATPTQKWLDLPDMSGFSEGEVFIIVEMDANQSDNYNTLWSMGAEADNFDQHYAFVTDGHIYEEWGTTARKATGDPIPPLNQWNNYHIVSAANLYTTWLNEIQHYTTAINTPGWKGSPLPRLGRNGNDSFERYLAGDVGRIVIFNTTLSVEDRAAIAAILKAQWDTP